MNQIQLEEQIENAFDELKILPEQKESILTFTNPLKIKDLSTWKHSARVGLKNIEVAKYTHIDNPKTWFYVGLLHDVGKALTDPISLKKTEGFGTKDKKELDRHVEDGCRLIRGVHNFTSEAIFWHHYFSGGYPNKRAMKKNIIKFSEATQLKAMYLGRFTGIVDFYDAITTRKNDKFSTDGKPQLPSKEQAKTIMEKANKDQIYFINQLYDSKIFN